jgi:succinate dehydrogenase/fumarate reductase flavoprotein subunit
MGARCAAVPRALPLKDEIYDVIVVGFGFAGGVAAIAAHDAGARVLLLEKQPDPGGISVCSAGGIRVAENAADALVYLKATNAGTTPDPVLVRLAEGMVAMPAYVDRLAARIGARAGRRSIAGNYPLPGYRTFGFVTVDDIRGFDPAKEFPNVRGSAAGARLFKLVLENVRLRPGITVRLGTAARKLIVRGGAVTGVALDNDAVSAERGVILACGGFEGAEDLKLQLWPLKPVRSAAVRHNTGDGLKMAAAVGAALWHTWHYHGSYGFTHPDPAYPFGIRLKRLPDWIPGDPVREDVRMSWILVDQHGRRFVNEYEPYMQDTGHRAMEVFDPVTQSLPRVPAFLLVDAVGRALYPLSAPTWHDAEVAARFGESTPKGLDEAILSTADSLDDLAGKLGLDPEPLKATVAAWNAACAAGRDPAFGRPPSSMMPIATPPFSAAPIWPIVSNTQGGPAHDEEQRVLGAFGAPIPGLYEAGEIGSVFGHLYLSGGNIAECFVGGRIAGEAAANARVP